MDKVLNMAELNKLLSYLRFAAANLHVSVIKRDFSYFWSRKQLK